MTQTGIIVAIDLGTSKITGVIGRRNENGVISVLHQESLSSENSIRRGTIYNIDKAGGIVKRIITLLGNKITGKVGQVYVSLAGQSVHSLILNEEISLSAEGGIVTSEVIDKLYAKAKKYQPDLKYNYAIADVEYFLDDKPEKNPVGVTCERIEAVFRIVVGRPNLIKNIQKVIEKSNVKIAGYIIGAISSADIVLTDEEKDLGCAFIDFGAGTTDLIVYKTGILRHFVTIPFGGKNITKDIAELNFVESDAEQYKMKFGKAKDSNEGFAFSSPFSSKPDIDLVELNKVIVFRLDEITANIKEQIKLSGYGNELGSGVVITGGGSQLKNIDLYLNQKLNLPVRKASARKSLINNVSDLVADPSMSTILGMLQKGNEDCEYIEPVGEDSDDKDVSSESNVTTQRSGNRWSGIFGKDNNSTKKVITKVKKTTNEVTDSIKDQEKFGDSFKNFFGGLFDETEDN